MMALPLLHVATTPYHFSWHIHPDVVLLCIVLLVGYAYAVTQLRDLVSDAGRVKRRQVVLWVSGVISLYLVAGTPVHEISEEYLFSVHMFQHTVFTMITAPLLLMGIPAWLWQAALRKPSIMSIARVLTRPVVAFGLYNALLVLTHLPPAVDYSLNHHWFHFVVHAVLVASAMLAWWPVVSVVPELPPLSAPLQMAYLFLQSLVPTVIAAFVTFSDSAIYSFYDKAPRMWGLTPVEDQQIAGGVMKLMGSLIIWGIIVVVFFQWYDREQKQTDDDLWPGVEDELAAMGLTKTAGSKPEQRP
jgi:putative membrane protein